MLDSLAEGSHATRALSGAHPEPPRPLDGETFATDCVIKSVPQESRRKEKVWQALTHEIDAWWLPDFHMVSADSIIKLEAVAGGQLLEVKDDGSSLLWNTVQMCETGNSLPLAGFVFPQWGGPGTTLLHLSLNSVEDGTTFKVQDAQFGALQPSAAKSMEEGWTCLFTDGLKKYVECSANRAAYSA